MQSQVPYFAKKYEIGTEHSKNMIPGRPSSQITPIIIVQQIMCFKNCCELLQIFGETGARESAIQCVIVILFLALMDSLGHM